MSLSVVTNDFISTQVGKSVEDVVPEGCSFDTLTQDGVVDRCFYHVDNERLYPDKEFAPVATNCIIRYTVQVFNFHIQNQYISFNMHRLLSDVTRQLRHYLR